MSVATRALARAFNNDSFVQRGLISYVHLCHHPIHLLKLFNRDLFMAPNQTWIHLLKLFNRDLFMAPNQHKRNR